MYNLNESNDLLDRVLWVYFMEAMGGHTTNTMLNAMKECKAQGLYEICKDYITDEIREAARLMAVQMVGDANPVIEEEKPEAVKTGCKSGCGFSDILGK